jgi:hypothetical protein
LERGFVERDTDTLFARLDWRFEPLAAEPRYEELLARIRQTVDPGPLSATLRKLAFLRR